MKINIRQAVKLFFASSSLEMVFKEAIANSLDANANKIDIAIIIDSFEKQESLRLDIADNGVGFTDERYNKFCELLKTENESHKGVGRLVYLSYFNKIHIESVFDNKKRSFTYDDDFDTENTDMRLENANGQANNTVLSFSECSMKRLSSYSIITPNYLKNEILREFYPRFYMMKNNNIDFNINISINIDSVKKNQIVGERQVSITKADIPNLKTTSIDVSQAQMFQTAELNYIVEKQQQPTDTFILTAFCVDDRAINLSDFIQKENLPQMGYNCIFLLKSSLFDGKVDPSRQTLTINDSLLKPLKEIFRRNVGDILQNEIPQIRETNLKTKESLDRKYPHLTGYFNQNDIGIISRQNAIETAQQKFFKDQKEILEAESLSDEKYAKALDVSSRTLAEYILYREKIIGKIESITKDNSESDIHNIILPQHQVYENGDVEQIYNNNLWLLDNKYMTYTTAMSEKTMKEVIDKFTDSNSEKDIDRPDIAIMFSDNPDNEENKPVDIVIIELKKRGIKLAKSEEAISQLKQRAMQFLKYYPTKIQRMWFYAIVEFTDDLKLSLMNEKYAPLYSQDSLYYKENEWQISLENPTVYKVGTYVLSIDAFINDAKANNEIFLKILKQGFQKQNSI